MVKILILVMFSFIFFRLWRYSRHPEQASENIRPQQLPTSHAHNSLAIGPTAHQGERRNTSPEPDPIELTRQSDEIEALRAELERKTQRTNLFETELESLRNALAEKDLDLAKRKKTIETLNSQLGAQTQSAAKGAVAAKELAELREESKRASRLASEQLRMHHSLADHDQRIANRSQQVKVGPTAEQQLNRQKAEIIQVTAERDSIKRRADEMVEEHQSLATSLSNRDIMITELQAQLRESANAETEARQARAELSRLKSALGKSSVPATEQQTLQSELDALSRASQSQRRSAGAAGDNTLP